MNDNNIFHNDLKPENVFIDKNYIAIIGDFGEIINYYYYFNIFYNNYNLFL